MPVERGLAELASSGLRASVFPLSLPFPSTVYSFPNSLLFLSAVLPLPLYGLFAQTLYSKHTLYITKVVNYFYQYWNTRIRYSIYGHFSAIPILLQSYCITALKCLRNYFSLPFPDPELLYASSIHSPRQLLLLQFTTVPFLHHQPHRSFPLRPFQCVFSNYSP